NWEYLKQRLIPNDGLGPKGRDCHAGAIINGVCTSPTLVVIGGMDSEVEPVNECLLLDTNQYNWMKIPLPDSVTGRFDHTVSSFVVDPNHVFLIVLGGDVKMEEKNVGGGVMEWVSTRVTEPNNTMVVELDNLECLSDVQVAEKKLFLIQGDKPQLMNWEKYGLRIGVQEGSLLSSETVEAAVVALVGGQFEFPPNTVLVSAVYAVSLSKPLLKRLKLEIQHCIDLTGRPDLAQYLKFAIAPMSTPSLPYLFKFVEGGEFSSNGGYGFIERKDFCLVSICGCDGGGGGGSTNSSSGVSPNLAGNDASPQDPVSQQQAESASTGSIPKEILKATTYAGLVYYEEKGVEDQVIFTAAKNLDALLEFIKKEHSLAEKGPHKYFRIASPSGYIELKFGTRQKKSFKGWTIEPHIEPCRLHQRDIHKFGDKDYSLPPSCLISIYSSPDAVPTLHYSVPVEGVADLLTLYIHRSRRTAYPNAVAPNGNGNDETIPAPTKRGREGGFDIKTAKKKIKQVMIENHSDFAGLLQFSLEDVANKLFEVHMIPPKVQQLPTYDAISTCFVSMMSLLDSKSDLEEHCMMFLEALSSVGGPIERVAKRLQEKWTAALEGALQFEQPGKR
uniref:Uncharacterized protein n=1 Tax=Amphimedon queenslandica TaxID=400682 RepID=A0A1X7TBH8_AMPQE